MQNESLVLFVGAYSDATSAKDDFEVLRSLEGSDVEVASAVVMSRAADGSVDVLSKGDGVTGGTAVIGGGLGFAVGLFAPPLLAATAVGAGLGAVLGHLVKRHEEKELGVELEEYFPPNSSAIVVVLDDKYLDRVEKALTKAEKRISKAIDSDDAEKLEKALEKSADDISDAIDS